ncbi:efflux RND transporter periplasmic adaptor subunit [Christensenella tenuis]|uniref:Efflux RND transporter periplasmic adaptor subunit n=1 Tax=Christensenella tenuis TaxID=2763033 RepID=A0ABR7EDT7_9FIRM|nr:efflux RND transporter periplasmic adaptor subunit [Christensenella tenuis]MBC5647926.1 efflux RND transporter periplasmic adaptor subunit [Christensenella tenuis]
MKGKKPSKKMIVALAVIITVVSIASYFGVTSAAGSDLPETIQREYPVTRGDITAGVSGQGVLHYGSTPQNFSEIVTIGEVLVKAGQAVKAGDKLVMADEEKLGEAIESAQSELEKTRIALKQAQSAKTLGELNAQKEAASQDAGSAETESQLIQASNAVDSLQQKVDALAAQISEIDTQLASLPEGDVQAAALNDKREVLTAELEAARQELENAQSSLSSLEDAKNRQDEAQAKSDAIDKKIADANSGSLQDAVDLAQLDVEAAQKKVDQLQELKDDPYLYASIDGVVLSLDAEPGAETKPESPAAVIGDPNAKTVTVPVSQSDIGKIEEGQAAEFTLDAFGDQKFTGKVQSRSLVPIKDSNPISYNVAISVDPNDAEMLDGMSANATIVLRQQKDVLQLSNKAIFLADGKQYVKMRNDDGTLRDVEIRTGFSDGKVSEITGGLSEGDTVIVEG